MWCHAVWCMCTGGSETSCLPHQGRCSLFCLPRRWTVFWSHCRIATSSHSGNTVAWFVNWDDGCFYLISSGCCYKCYTLFQIFLVYSVKFNIPTQIGNLLLCFCSWDCFLWHEIGLFVELFLATLICFWWIMMSVWDSWWLYIILFFSLLYCQQYLPIPL